METYTIKDLSFSYPESDRKVLYGLNLDIKEGEFVVLLGKSGSGKTTLLRQLKPTLAAHGKKSGQILFQGRPLEELDQRDQAQKIGFVLQRPENQLVTDKVWHELAFGLESLGLDNQSIRLRVAEMASFFGIQHWFYQDVASLSGGQKQMLNLAGIMAMQPSVLLLDEPTSQLDPIAAANFLDMLKKINQNLGTTILLSEHRLEEVIDKADRLVVLDQGKVHTQGTIRQVIETLSEEDHPLFAAMPLPSRVHGRVKNDLPLPITIREGRTWLQDYSQDHQLQEVPIDPLPSRENKKPSLELSHAFFRYEKAGDDMIKDASFVAYPGELTAIVGGNGTGKTTLLSLLSGVNRPYRGDLLVEGQPIDNLSQKDRYLGLIGAVPQDPQTLFVKKTVMEELEDMADSSEEGKYKLGEVVALCQLQDLLHQHPYDLSGGEQQRLALAKILLLKPRILLLDEPTKGLDAEFKATFASIIQKLLKEGLCIVMVSHDLEFCASYAHYTGLFFDGSFVAFEDSQTFFAGNNFYTSQANRMAREVLPRATRADHIIAACGGDPEEPKDLSGFEEIEAFHLPKLETETEKLTVAKVNKGPLPTRTKLALVLILLTIPLTIFLGIRYLNDRKYLWISLAIIIQVMLPFFLSFEGRKPQARELVVIGVLVVIAVAGRAAFFMLPQFKPTVAITIIGGIALGAESGFLIGSSSMLLSNIFSGQGPWTPWQMFAMGIIGFLAGLVFRWVRGQNSQVGLLTFGGLSAFFIYGGIMNPAAVLMAQQQITLPMIIASYATGLPFDIVHAVSTVFFLYVLGRPMLEKLERIKVKYGLIQAQAW